MLRIKPCTDYILSTTLRDVFRDAHKLIMILSNLLINY